MNNPATREFLRMLPDYGPLPALKQIEQRAADQLLQSLTKLAQQCAAAQCQPLEVFARSVQCSPRVHEPGGPAAPPGAYDWQRRKKQQQRMPPAPKRSHELVKKLQRRGLQQPMAALISTYWQIFHAYSEDSEAERFLVADLEHMLPGIMEFMGSSESDKPSPNDLAFQSSLVSCFKTALQAYQVRAAECGQTYEHMVLLEAAVQGWSLDTPLVGDLLHAMIEAEPGRSFARKTSKHNARPSTSPSGAKVTSGQEQVPQKIALSCLEKCPPAILTIFRRVLSILNLSDKDLSPIPARALSREEIRLNALLTGLFPGITEELSCAVDSENADMCPHMVTSAARHVKSFVQVWRTAAKEERLSISELLHNVIEALGFKPSELPADVESAICDISTGMRKDPLNIGDRHRPVLIVLAMMHDASKAGQEATSEYWLLKALAQQLDLSLYCDGEDRVVQADRALLKGPCKSMAEKLHPSTSEEDYLGVIWHVKKQVLQIHVMDAQTAGKSLRAYLEDIAGYRRDGWGAGKADVGHLIALLDAAHCSEEELSTEVATQVGQPGVAWRTVAQTSPHLSWVMESAFEIANTMGGVPYAALRSIFPGLPSYVPNDYKSELGSGLLVETVLVKQQIMVYMHIAHLQKVKIRRYIEKLLNQHRIDTSQQAGATFLEAIDRAMPGIRVNLPMAKTMHICMCIKNVLHKDHAAEKDRLLVLLDTVMLVRTHVSHNAVTLRAIRQAIPGLLDCLSRLHKWPDGLDEKEEWLAQATQIIRDIMARHVRDARNQGITPEKHVRKALSVPGLRNEEAEDLTYMFEKFWAAERKEECAAADQLTAESPSVATSSSASRAAADSVSASGQLSQATANGGTADASSAAAQAHVPSQHGGDVAADVAGGANNKHLADQGQGLPEQSMDGAGQSQSGVSEAERAEKRRSKKARQRAARAQAAAQTAQTEGTDSKEPGRTDEGVVSASKQKPSAEAEDADQPPEAVRQTGGTSSTAPGSLSAHTSEIAASSSLRSSSVSPPPSLHLHDELPQGQQNGILPSSAAQAAQAPAPAAQDEGPWQEVSKPRHRAGSEQGASKATVCKPPVQGRAAPDQEKLPPPHCREVHAAAQHSGQALPRSEKAAVPSRAQSASKAAEYLAGSGPQQPSQHVHPDPVQHPSLQASSAHVQAAQADVFEEEHQDEDEEGLCTVCWEQGREVIFFDCMHMCTCQGCAKDIMAAGALCPMCRASIRRTITAKFE